MSGTTKSKFQKQDKTAMISCHFCHLKSSSHWFQKLLPAESAGPAACQVQPQVQDSGPLAQETEHFDDSRIKSVTFPKLVGVQLFLHLEQCFDHILTMLKWSVISSVLDPFVNGPFPCSSTQMPSLTQNMQHRSCLHHHSNGPAHEVAAFSDSTSSKHLGQPSSSPILQELGLAHQGMTPHPSANPKPGHSALQQWHSALHRTHPCHWSI